jgi:hypothetical protein
MSGQSSPLETLSIIPGRGIPAGGVAPRSNMLNIHSSRLAIRGPPAWQPRWGPLPGAALRDLCNGSRFQGLEVQADPQRWPAGIVM